MHEMSIVQSILSIIDQELVRHDVSTLRKVVVRHGVMANVVPEALHFAWEALTLGTPHEGAVLETEEVPLKARCCKCDMEFEPESASLIMMICPECGEEFGHQIISGRELDVKQIEAE